MKEELFISIGERISTIRKQHHLSQEKLAEALQVSQKHISHVERGCSNLSLEHLIEFCQLFNCSLDYLILGTSHDSALSKLPSKIYQILAYGSTEDIECLNRYLKVYIELLNKQE